jgi:hypothetical protein
VWSRFNQNKDVGAGQCLEKHKNKTLIAINV